MLNKTKVFTSCAILKYDWKCSASHLRFKFTTMMLDLYAGMCSACYLVGEEKS